jgi:hypothetical protein
LTGIGRLLQFRGRIQLYWVNLLWSLNVFLYLVLNWWILFRWQSQGQWNFFLFLFVLLSPTVAYLLSELLFPAPLDVGSNLRQHFYQNHRWFFLLAALLPLIDAGDTRLKGYEHFVAQGPIYVVTIVLLFGLNLIAAWTRREWFHKVFSVFFLVYITAFISINLRIIG